MTTKTDFTKPATKERFFTNSYSDLTRNKVNVGKCYLFLLSGSALVSCYFSEFVAISARQIINFSSDKTEKY